MISTSKTALDKTMAGSLPKKDQIDDPTLADGILDRLVHNAHRIELRGDFMPKNRVMPNT